LNKLIAFLISVFLITTSVHANKWAKCAVTYNFMGTVLQNVGEYKKADDLKKMSKIIGKVLVENYGKLEAATWVKEEGIALQQHYQSNPDGMINFLESNLKECNSLLKK